MLDVSREGEVHIITMNREPNTVQPDFVSAMHEALDTIEGAEAGAMVLTGRAKTFNSGLEVATVMALEGDAARDFGQNLMRLMQRLLIGPTPVVAAINGHAFAAGAFLALACDFRVMRDDRGWICISEVDVGVPIGAPLMSLLRAKLPTRVAAEAVLTGRRYGAKEAVDAHFADASASQSDLLDIAVKHANELAAKERGIMATLKQTLWADVAASLTI